MYKLNYQVLFGFSIATLALCAPLPTQNLISNESSNILMGNSIIVNDLHLNEKRSDLNEVVGEVSSALGKSADGSSESSSSSQIATDVKQLVSDAEQMINKIKLAVELMAPEQTKQTNKPKEVFINVVRPLTEKPIVTELPEELIEVQE
ncbi:hypothetical protein MJO28_001645 [Puccinia striiformis f. sp. tritici]|uniref:Uncharacterized protein n=2 Tax=Puccinia striiformis TaxID=27350 RepID=A0A2S4UIL2_9BASI|nr:hypothetical protein MJO28_001645 [Puccinia striiformis f. sp. tritici]POV97135.1 hypothetical protein PSHT_14730 [Puccinia striiformis]